ncbi:MAG: HU family DNA-binding protein [Phycisphaerales bacterium]
MAKTANSTAKKPRSKSQLFADIAEHTQLTRKQVAGVFDALGTIMKRDLGKKGPEVFVVPGLMKVTVRSKPATKAREGVNPFTGEKIMIKAKPASRVARIRAMKALKAML